MDLFLDYLNPFIVFRNYVRIPVEAFVRKQCLDYKLKANKGVNSVKDLLFRVGIIWLFVTAILWISVFMYVVFYYTYMPNVTHVRPVHLQFKSCEEQTGVCSFPSAHVQLTKRSHMLMAAQPYRIKLILDMPESQINKELGMFMVCAQMRAKGGVLVSSSCRSAMLRHRCRHLCFGRARATPGSEGELIAYKEWKELSRDLNYAGDGPWRSGKEWMQYWTDLKNRTKSKVAVAKRRSKFTGVYAHPKLNCWEHSIIELADIAAREQQAHSSYSSSTDAIPADTTQGIAEPKSESTPNTSGNGNVQVGNENNTQSQSGVNCGYTLPPDRSYTEPEAKTNQGPPNPTLPPNTPIPSEFRSESVLRLAEAVLALASANQSIADSLRALANRHSN